MIGRRLRVKTDGTRIHKIHLKESDRKTIENKLPALALVYRKLTNRIISFEFVKNLVEEKRKKKAKKENKKDGKKEIKREPKKEAPKAEEVKSQ